MRGPRARRLSGGDGIMIGKRLGSAHRPNARPVARPRGHHAAQGPAHSRLFSILFSGRSHASQAIQPIIRLCSPPAQPSSCSRSPSLSLSISAAATHAGGQPFVFLLQIPPAASSSPAQIPISNLSPFQPPLLPLAAGSAPARQSWNSPWIRRPRTATHSSLCWNRPPEMLQPWRSDLLPHRCNHLLPKQT